MQEQGNSTDHLFQSKVLGHPAGLFVLFFTEMWERFSYYGMRALFVLFLVSAFGLGGWDWPREHALALYGTYTGLVYITPILGGYLADRFLGYKKAVVIGAVIMTLGHASMAIESNPIFLYIGISLLIIGNGFFKPNMTSIISHMYKNYPKKKDGAYTIFYMGVNAGAFLGILMCGYIGEKVGWGYGFGLAGIFMLLGMIQFQLSHKIFGKIGDKPEPQNEENGNDLEFEGDRKNPFTMVDKILVVLSAIIGVVWIINDPVSKINGFNVFLIGDIDYSNHAIVTGLILFGILLVTRIVRYPRITRDRMVAIVFFAIMTVIFWMCFEQAGGSMNIFAKDYTNRVMTGSGYTIYMIVNTIITVVPVLIITWVLFRLIKETRKEISWGNVVLGSSFVIIWGIVFWIINNDLKTTSYDIEYEAVSTVVSPEYYNATEERSADFKSMLEKNATFMIGADKERSKRDRGVIDSVEYKGEMIKHEHSKSIYVSVNAAEQKLMDSTYSAKLMAIDSTALATVYYTKKDTARSIPMNQLVFETVISEGTEVAPNEEVVALTTTIMEPTKFEKGDVIALYDVDKKGGLSYLNKDKEANVRKIALENNEKSSIVNASIIEVKTDEIEIPATWFLILNSLFIIMFAPLFSKWWESKYNPNASSKYGLGLILLGIGFGALAFGSAGIPKGAETASVSLIWLVLAYLFHTLGELCLSPVALSYVSKLVPGRMIAMMFGVWYIAVAIGNKLAGTIGGMIDQIKDEYSMSTFFMIFTLLPIGLGLIGVLVSPLIKKLMHGVH